MLTDVHYGAVHISCQWRYHVVRHLFISTLLSHPSRTTSLPHQLKRVTLPFRTTSLLHFSLSYFPSPPHFTSPTPADPRHSSTSSFTSCVSASRAILGSILDLSDSYHFKDVDTARVSCTCVLPFHDFKTRSWTIQQTITLYRVSRHRVVSVTLMPRWESTHEAYPVTYLQYTYAVL